MGPGLFSTQTTNKLEPWLYVCKLFTETEPQTPTTGHNMIVYDSRDYYCSIEPLRGPYTSFIGAAVAEAGRRPLIFPAIPGRNS